MTAGELRAEITAEEPALEIVWIGRLCENQEPAAIVADAWGSYQWEFFKAMRKPATEETHVAPLAVQRSLF